MPPVVEDPVTIAPREPGVVASRLARLPLALPRLVLAASGLVAVAAALVFAFAGASLAPFSSRDPGSGSEHARALLAHASGVDRDFDVVALVRLPDGLAAASSRQRLQRVARVISADPRTAGVLVPARAGPLVARDQRSALVVGGLRAGPEAAQLDAARRLKQRFAGNRGVLVGGQAAFYANGNDVAERDLLRTDLYAGAILALLAFWVFRSAVAALFVVLVGGFTVVVTSGALAALAHFTEVSAYARNVVSGLGLGLGVDYSLLLVSRLREEAVADGYGRPALERTLNTAGRTLTVSAAIVAGAGVSLLVFPQPLLRSIGLAVILVAVCAWLAARLPLTALLLLLGSRVNQGTPARWRDRLTPASRPDRHSWLYRHVQRVQARPWPPTLTGGGLLILLALPITGIRFTQVDPNVVPRSSPDRQVSETIQRAFPTPNALTPVYAAIRAPDTASAAHRLQAYAGELRALPGVGAVGAAEPVGDGVWRLDVVARGPVLGAGAQRLVRTLRAAPALYPTVVGGQSAQLVDLLAGLNRRLTLALVILLACTVGPLAWATRSVWLPVKTAVLNALTVAAAFGVLVLVFQDGRVERLLGYTSSGALEAATMAVVAAIAFALATDYGVFLLTRIKQERDAGFSDDAAVARALQRTGPVLTKAAVLLAVALGSLVFAQHALVKQVGVGTAVAVILDAWLVRLFLVPSLMRLFGPRFNWWPGRHSR
jgi:uncharacterized membrane protein YdfJ with MMPL/SSD domain